MKKHLICQSSQLLMIITVFVYIIKCIHARFIKKVSLLPSQLGIFVFTFTVKRFHIYGALLHLALKVFTFTGPYYIFTYRGATDDLKLTLTYLISRSNLLPYAFTWEFLNS